MMTKFFSYTLVLFTLLVSSALTAQNSDEAMKQLIKERKQNNLESRDADVIKIQIYNGLSEAKAKATKNKFDGIFPGYGSKLSYEQPDWKVQVGYFTSEIEVYRALERIRVEFPGAFKFKVKRNN